MGFLKVVVAAVVTALLLLAALIVLLLRSGAAAIPFAPALAAGAVSLLTPGEAPVTYVAPSPTIVSWVYPAGAEAIVGDDPTPVYSSDLPVTRGIASGAVTASSAVLWVAASGPSQVSISVRPERWSPSEPPLYAYVATVADSDQTVAVPLEQLEPNTAYLYEVSVRRPIGAQIVTTKLPQVGRFRTAPDPSTARNVSFVFSGDLGGGGFCRPPDGGYAIFDAMRELRPDFFLAMGDMVYADNTCPATSPLGEANVPSGIPSVANRGLDWTNYEQMREVYLQHWRYNRADERFQAFLRETPMYALWDDHEVLNDSGARWTHHNVANAERAGYPTLVAAGRDAFFAYNPIPRDPAELNRLYRRVRWGADLDLFLLDARSYRSRNDTADTPENQKTMLGREQLHWLKDELRQSTATWKVVATSVPLSLPTGGLMAAIYGRDSWANGTSWDYSSQTGFERELLDLLRSFDEARVRNLVFVAADAHQAVEIRYATDLDGDGRPLIFHEVVAGPLGAPATRAEPQLDPTLSPTKLYYEGGFFNFGHVRIERAPDGLAHLIAEIRGADGQPRAGSRLDLTPAP